MSLLLKYLLIRHSFLEIKSFSETNKAAMARVRKNTLVLEKLGKAYRKASLEATK